LTDVVPLLDRPVPRAEFDPRIDGHGVGVRIVEDEGHRGVAIAIQHHRQVIRGRTLALRTECAQADPKDYRAAISVASSTTRIGTLLHKMGDLRGSLQALQQAEVLYADLVKLAATDWRSAHGLGDVHIDMAETLADMHSPAATLAEYGKARIIFADLRARGVLGPTDDQVLAEAAAAEAKLRRVAR
jgi:hypothetical protein